MYALTSNFVLDGKIYNILIDGILLDSSGSSVLVPELSTNMLKAFYEGYLIIKPPPGSIGTGGAGTGGGGPILPQEYTYNQIFPSNEWVITHSLNRHPACLVLDDQGNVMEGDLVYTSLDIVTISFSKPVAGSAYFN